MNEMIDMGGDSGGFCPGPGKGCKQEASAGNFNCNGVGIEHLILDGNNLATRGIVNDYSEEVSYVNDVAMIRLQGTGLTVGVASDGNGNNSGPYSNLYISTAGQCASIGGSAINGPLKQTRGIHGLTCATGATSVAAMAIDYSINNTIEDVSISFTGSGTGPDGIDLGPNGIASGNVLMNITGAHLTDVIHIEKSTSSPSSTTCPGSAGYNACDLTIAGVSGTNTTYTIEDQLPGGKNLMDSSVGLYMVGEQIGLTMSGSPSGISRFTTSTNVPTWLVGTAQPSQNACVVIGELYSNVSATGGNPALYACKVSGQSGVWTPIPSNP